MDSQHVKDAVAVRARVLHAYTALKPGELSLGKGDIVTVLDQSQDDWWKGEAKSQIGFFPRDYVSVLPRVGEHVFAAVRTPSPKRPDPSPCAKVMASHTRGDRADLGR